MRLTNRGTPLDDDGLGDILTDIETLFLMMAGKSNDMNAASKGVDQSVTEIGFPLTVNNLSEFANSPDALTQIRRNLGVTPGACLVSKTSSTTFGSLTDTLIFNTVVDDAASTYNTTTGRFTAPVSGVYTFGIVVNLRTQTMILGPRTLSSALDLYRNGTVALASTDFSGSFEIPAPSGGTRDYTFAIAASARLAANDAITLVGYGVSSSGANFGQFITGSFSATWIPQ